MFTTIAMHTTHTRAFNAKCFLEPFLHRTLWKDITVKVTVPMPLVS